MKIAVKVFYVICSIIFLIYLSIPNPKFPDILQNSIQSFEPADVETPLRRAYYTDMTREEVMSFYVKEFKSLDFINIKITPLVLNYPPEEAQTIIRDQTRSTFLEEIVHPFRESVYINGFEPKLDKDMIFIDGRKWRQKIIVKYIPSNPLVRTAIGILILVFIPILYSEYKKIFEELVKKQKK